MPTRTLELVTDHRPRPAPLDPPMVPFVLTGMVGWAIVGLALLAAQAPGPWLWTCLAGVLLGLVVLPIMIRHDRHRTSRRASAAAG